MKRIIALLFIATLTAASCHQVTDTIRETLHPDSTRAFTSPVDNGTTHGRISVRTSPAGGETARPEKGAGLLKDATRLEAAQKALRALPAFGGKPVRLYQHVHFYDDGRINARVQHPGNPSYVDEYKYENGRWQHPEPVQLSVRDDVEKALVNLDDLQFSAVAELYKQYTQKAAGVEGAGPLTHVYIFIRNNRFAWYPRSLSGSRERYHISFRKNGELERFYRE